VGESQSGLIKSGVLIWFRNKLLIYKIIKYLQ
jgi:hypothetical protein